ncbi:hypothetical protein EXIGLDRAFT_717843 [Exidia glandulosa HHB12029]|uniref:MARVEL domain-containing protein n=1 Tax=Exidia glandulosa HHB12029 TaxID=1314781 RepID=A0A166AKP0_EXIGL|nr:hypothetical protein EXIGLDRAFT_717843 [Exidia glandulosa HHB12029]
MFHGFRIFLFVFLWLLACVLLGLSADRIWYTRHLPTGDPLNNGKPFYDPIIAELLFTTSLAILWIPWILLAIGRRREGLRRYSFTHSVVGLFILTVLFIVGAAVSAHFWGGLSWCHRYWQCRILTALVGVAWAAALVSLLLFILEFHYAWRHRAWGYPMHGRYDPANYNSSNYPIEKRRWKWF